MTTPLTAAPSSSTSVVVRATETTLGTTPASKVSPDAEVSAAYQAALDAELEASTTSDQTLPALTATHLDPVLKKMKDGLIGRRVEGQAARRPEPSVSRTVVLSTSVSNGVAELDECTVDDSIVFVVATGAVVNDAVTTLRRHATLRQDGGVWKVSDRSTVERWDGVAGCAVS